MIDARPFCGVVPCRPEWTAFEEDHNRGRKSPQYDGDADDFAACDEPWVGVVVEERPVVEENGNFDEDNADDVGKLQGEGELCWEISIIVEVISGAGYRRKSIRQAQRGR